MILPTYNERATIGAVLDGLTATGAELDILVVDDGSPDGTGEIVRERSEADPRIRLVERPRKSGLASAYAVGFDARSPRGTTWPSRWTRTCRTGPRSSPRLLEAAHRHHLVIGSRYVPGGSVTNWSRARVALSKAGNLYARFCLGFDVHDATSGFRVYRREALEEITATPITLGRLRVPDRARLPGLEPRAVGRRSAISFREREHGQSKISRRIVVEALWLVTLWGLRARFRPDPEP